MRDIMYEMWQKRNDIRGIESDLAALQDSLRHSIRQRSSGWRTPLHIENKRNAERARVAVRLDSGLALEMVNSELQLNRFTIHQIQTQNLGIRKVCAKIVPKSLMIEQKHSLDFLYKIENGAGCVTTWVFE
ncbi:hypothetical protein Trydic_g5438 [Trypoxylus dichotomus]